MSVPGGRFVEPVDLIRLCDAGRDAGEGDRLLMVFV